MSNDKNVHIKLELSKDKNSGKINLIARFNNKAPNILFENNEYFWIPTIEEKDLLNEAFELVPSLKGSSFENISEPKEELIEPKVEENEIKQEPPIKTSYETPLEEEPIKTSYNPSSEESVLEKPVYEEPKEKSSIFKITREDKIDDPDNNINDLNEPKVEIKTESDNTGIFGNKKIDTDDDLKKNETDDNIEKNTSDEAIIVEADNDAIQAALKKRNDDDFDDDDKTLVEADEKTIIDKVLKQKKKGKWSKK